MQSRTDTFLNLASKPSLIVEETVACHSCRVFTVWLVFSPVTGQLADTPTRGLPTRGLDISRTGQLADKTTRALVNSRTGQVADWTTRGLADAAKKEN